MGEHKFVVSQCCCCCTLKTGAIIIGVLNLIGSIIQVVSKAYSAIAHGVNALWFDVIVFILLTIVAVLLLNGIRTNTAKQIWVWVYVALGLAVLQLIGAIVVVVSLGEITFLIAGLVVFALEIYFVVVVRSYAFEVESGGGGNTV